MVNLSVYQIATIVASGLALALGFIDVFLALRKKRNSSLYKVVQKIPSFIAEAESCLGAGHGVQKLVYVLAKIQNECVLHGVKYDEEAFKYEVENILTTPTKKEDHKNETL